MHDTWNEIYETRWGEVGVMQMDAEKSHIFVLYSCEVIITTRSGTEQRG